jgi:dihydrodipicolinate synthase/N-acetylneuraminate lyase
VANATKALRGSCPLVLTAFKENEDLDLDALKMHIDWLIDKGAPGLFLTGSWGEYTQLSDDERKQVIEGGLKHVNGRVPVFVGICGLGQTTRASIGFAKVAEGAGADGLMIKQYLYVDQSERHGPAAEADVREGLLEYFGSLSKAVKIPIMLYNSVWGWVTASPAAQAELAERGYIQYVKECTGIVTMQRTIKLAGDKLVVFNGMEDSAFPAFVLGAEGWCTGTASVIPEMCIKLFNLVQEGKIHEAKDLWYRIMPLTIFLEGGKGIQLMKYASALQGIPIGTARKSRASLTPDEKKKMERMLKDLGVI